MVIEIDLKLKSITLLGYTLTSSKCTACHSLNRFISLFFFFVLEE